MRLINTSTLELVDSNNFSRGLIPKYAILSHTWGHDKDEVSFADMVGTVTSDVKWKPGFKKIEMTCQIAREKYKLDYAWVDTCCIEKSSSAELSESINSMFSWYSKAEVCIAFLCDLESGAQTINGCNWLTRGWTLQEMIAPKELVLYNKLWELFGSKRDLCQMIAEASGVSEKVLNGSVALVDVPVAVRMSWAADRSTKRPEDRAYSLLGIFDVNIPMLYGEGGKAFTRLQEAIVAQTTDMSIFAWTARGITYSGLLAPSPTVFKSAGSLVPHQESLADIKEFSNTNRGFRFKVAPQFQSDSGLTILPVNHHDPENAELQHSSYGIYLRQIGPQLFVRAHPDSLGKVMTGLTSSKVELQVVKSLTSKQVLDIETNIIHIIETEGELGTISQIHPSGCFDRKRGLLFAGHLGSFIGWLHFAPSWDEEYDTVVLLCLYHQLGHGGSPWGFRLIAGDDWKNKRGAMTELNDDDPQSFYSYDGSRELHLRHLFQRELKKVVAYQLDYATHPPTLTLEITGGRDNN